jgi:hypothetical protein
MVAGLGHHPFGRITMTVYEMRTYTLHVVSQEVKLLTAAPWGPHP